MTGGDSHPILVVAGIIRGDGGRVLVARRPDGRHMGGLWEFPGGKVEPGEDPAAALERELEEELGITARVGAPVTFAVHREPEGSILLLFYEVVIAGGDIVPREGQAVRWVEPAGLAELAMPPADGRLVAAIARGGRVAPG